MVAPVDICNAAIVRLGGQQVTSLLENSVEAISLNSQYDIVRRNLLRSHPWNFATRRMALAQDLTRPPFGYGFSYNLPADYLRVLATNDQIVCPYYRRLGGDFNGYVTVNHSVDVGDGSSYKIEGKKLMSNDGTMKIIYTADITDTNLFDPSFVELMAIRLAMVTSFNITGSVQTRKDLADEFNYLLNNAQTNNGQEGVRNSIENSSWIASRWW